jgi:hypothetical protein
VSKRILVIALAAALIPASLTHAQTVVTVEPDSPTVGNCFPFGDGDTWLNYMAFFYVNVPAFNLQPGDILAFDLGAQNGADPQLQIEMATHDGATWPNTDASSPYTTLVTNTQTPENPNGNTIVGDYELRYTVEAPYSFPGGNLIIRFSNPSAAYRTHTSCDQVLVRANASDTSGFFLGRTYNDDDGSAPWDSSSTSSIGGFQVEAQEGGTPIPTIGGFGTLMLIALLAGAGLIAIRRL